MDITKIDPNFKVDERIERPGMLFRSIEETPFRIYGVFREGERFMRLPKAIADKVSPGVSHLATNLAGGRVRFRTNSPYVAIHAELCSKYTSDHITHCGSFGLDLYMGKAGEMPLYRGTFRPPAGTADSYQSLVTLPDGEWEVTINLPLYSGLRALYVGLDEKAALFAPTPYKYEKKPVLYYGSSVTQGGCASRAGMSYQGILSRRLDTDFINLGFSGSARGEDAMIDYLASLDPSVFVLDYDFNAPTPEHLLATHEKLFLAFRRAHPLTPVIMLSKSIAKSHASADTARRREIILTTYENARARGDDAVFFIDGTTIVDEDSHVDGVHPTDHGFIGMANGIEPILKQALEIAYQ